MTLNELYRLSSYEYHLLLENIILEQRKQTNTPDIEDL